MTLNRNFLKITLVQELKNYFSLTFNRLKAKEPDKLVQPADSQAEKLREIGSSLEKARLEQKLSLKNVSMQTQIPVDILQAMEKGELENLPPLVYLRGMIKRYALVVDLEINNPFSDSPTEVKTTQVKSLPRFGRLPTFHLQPIHLYALYIILIFFSIQKVANILEQSTAVVNTTETTKSDKPVKVDIRLKEKAWVKVIADGQTKFEGVLPSGTQKTWRAKEDITVSTGKTGSVLITFNKKKNPQVTDHATKSNL